jgi:hypothetical protein
MRDFFTIHELKTDPEAYDETEQGLKANTVRYNDRGYTVDDYIILRRTNHTGWEMGPMYPEEPKALEYSGKALMCKIIHVQEHKGLQPGWVVLSFVIVDEFPTDSTFGVVTSL